MYLLIEHLMQLSSSGEKGIKSEVLVKFILALCDHFFSQL